MVKDTLTRLARKRSMSFSGDITVTGILKIRQICFL